MSDVIRAFDGLFAEWRDHAACLDKGEDEWFLGDPPDPELIAKGKALCNSCPVRIECLDDDMRYGVQGVRGGLDDAQKLKLLRHRQRYNRYFESDVGPAMENVASLTRNVKIKLKAA